MMTQVVVLNGGSSSGKTGIARCLQAILPQPWIRLGVDNLVDALPPSLTGAGAGIGFGQQGEVTVGGGFREAEDAWLAGVAAMARAGARVIYDDVFLGGRLPRNGCARTWRAWGCCGWQCAAPPRSPPPAKRPGTTG